MRVTTVVSTLLISSVFAAPAPRPENIQDANPFNIEERSDAINVGDIVPGSITEAVVDTVRTETNSLDLPIKRSTEDDLSGSLTSILASLHLPLPATSGSTLNKKKDRRSTEDDLTGDIISVLSSLHLPRPALPATGDLGLKSKRSTTDDLTGDLASIMSSLHLPLPATKSVDLKEKRSTEDEFVGDLASIFSSLHLPLPAAKAFKSKRASTTDELTDEVAAALAELKSEIRSVPVAPSFSSLKSLGHRE